MPRLRGALVLAACAVALLALPAGARAASASAVEVRALAARALAGDADALATLRAVDGVDGAPLVLARVLPDGLAAPELERRLATLAAGGAAASPADAAAARATAADVLAADRFHEQRDEGLVRDVLAAIGHALEPIASRLAPLVGGAWQIVTLLAVAVVLGLAVFLVARARRAAGAAAAERERRSERAARDPAELERLADAAAAAGDDERALRLRFEAGLVRLDRAGAIRLRESTTSGGVRATLGPSGFDELADAHDDVVYGGRPIAPDDLAAARERWPELLEEVRRR